MNPAEYYALLREGRRKYDLLVDSLPAQQEEARLKSEQASSADKESIVEYEAESQQLRFAAAVEMSASVEIDTSARATAHNAALDADREGIVTLRYEALRLAGEKLSVLPAVREAERLAYRAKGQWEHEVSEHRSMLERHLRSIVRNREGALEVQQQNRRGLRGDVVTTVGALFFLLVYATLVLDGLPFGNSFFLILPMAAIYAFAVLLLPSFVYPRVAGGSKGGLWALGVLMALGLVLSGVTSLLGLTSDAETRMSVPSALFWSVVGGGILVAFAVRVRRAVGSWRAVKSDIKEMDEEITHLEADLAHPNLRLLSEATEREVSRLKE